jgi:HEAT repeat protein
MLNGLTEGEVTLQKWMQNSHGDLRGLAAAALSMTGKRGSQLSLKELESQPDPYVKATLAIGLIGQRVEVKKACDVLTQVFFERQNTLWMWQEAFPFRFLSESDVPHTHQIPNYPHVIDRLAKLEVLHILNVMRSKKAEDAMRLFLKSDSWRTVGVAASMLLQEGDEESLDLVRGLLDDEDEAIRVQAAIILALVGSDSSATQVLQDAYPHVDREMKIHILEALGHIGTKESIPFLIEILKEPFQMLRVVAASALIQCIYH